VGDELLNLPKGEGYRYIMTGLPYGMTHTSIIAHTTMIRAGKAPWKCVPVGLGGPRSTTPGRVNMLVIAKEECPMETCMFNLGHSMHMIQIKPEVRSKQQLAKGWDSIGQVVPQMTSVAPASSSVWSGQTWQPSLREAKQQPATRPFSAWLSANDVEPGSPRHTKCGPATPANRFNKVTPNRKFPGTDKAIWADITEETGMDQSEHEGRMVDQTGGLDNDSASDENGLPDGFFDDAAKFPPQQQQQQLPTIPTVQAHISFQNDFWEQIAKMDKERKAFEAETLQRQVNSDNEVATIRRDAAQAAADAQKMTAKVLEQLGHAQGNFEATLRRAEEIRVVDQKVAAEAVAAAATASAAGVTAAAVAAAAVAEKQNSLIASILALEPSRTSQET